MAPTKRPAGTSLGGAAKKQALSVHDKCKGIKKTLLGAEGFPKEVLGMLAGSLEVSMGSCKEERHEFQQSTANMVATVLKSVEAAANAAVEAAKAKVDELSGPKGDRDAASEAAAIAQVAKKEATKEKKEAEVKAMSDVKAAKSAITEAKEKQKSGDAEFEASQGKKKKLEAFFTGAFEQMKAGSLDEVATKQGCAELLKLGKEYKFPDFLLESLPSAIHKAPEVRGSFDTLCFSQIEGEFKSHIETLTATIAGIEPAKAEHAAAVAAAEEAFTAAEQQEHASKAALLEAKKEEHEADEALKAAKQAVKDFKPQFKPVCDALDAATAHLNDLQVHALVPFQELLEWSKPPPEPEPAAPVAAEPAATEPAA